MPETNSTGVSTCICIHTKMYNVRSIECWSHYASGQGLRVRVGNVATEMNAKHRTTRSNIQLVNKYLDEFLSRLLSLIVWNRTHFHPLDRRNLEPATRPCCLLSSKAPHHTTWQRIEESIESNRSTLSRDAQRSRQHPNRGILVRTDSMNE